jgi:SPRY domain-containing SOCS box protein 3
VLYLVFVLLFSGRDDQSWGLSYKGNTWHKGQPTRYCDPFYDQSTVIGVHLNLYTGTITFYKDGKSLGVAFKAIETAGKEFYPVICSTAINTELEVGIQTCRYSSLHEKCCLVVAQSVDMTRNIKYLPLPNLLKSHLQAIKSDVLCV